MAAAHRPDVRRSRAPLPLRLGHVVAKVDRARPRRRGPRADRRRAAHPRPPRRQPRRRRPGAAADGAGASSPRPPARRGSAAARGLAPWATPTLEHSGRPTIEITATPCRHGPPLSATPSSATSSASPSAGTDSEHGVAVDLRRHGAVPRRAPGRRPARRRHRRAPPRRRALPDHRSAALHDDGRRRHRTLRARSRTRSFPVHYEGWSHFRQGRSAIERAIASAPPDARTPFRLLPIGSSEQIDV